MTITAISRPEKGEYGDYYQGYIDQVTETDVISALESQMTGVRDLLGNLTDQQVSVLHAPYTWTLKQVVGHCIDAERVFGYRALRFASGDQTHLPGFDQDAYVANSNYDGVSMAALLDELEYLRRGNIAMFKRVDDEMWKICGTASGFPMSVRALAYVLVGHIRHHMKIMQQRLA